MTEELSKAIESLNLPEVVKEDLRREHLSHQPAEMAAKEMAVMSSDNGRKAAIILWEDDSISTIVTNSSGKPHVSSANSPEMFYIAKAHYIALGLSEKS